MQMRLKSSLVLFVSATAIVFAALYITYRLVDPLSPRRLVIAAGMAGSGYDRVARRYGKILARHGVELDIRNSAGAVEDLNLLRDRGVRHGLWAHLEILTSVRSLLSGGDVGTPDAKPEFAYLWRIARAKPSADALTGCFSD
jgi:hypothetical protein